MNGEMMNDPHVVALIYRVEHKDSVSYENADPLRDFKTPEFDLTVEDKIARFEFKQHYADEDEALEAIESFIQHWEFLASMRFGPGRFGLRFKEAEIIDRNPLPSESGTRRPGSAGLVLGNISARAGLILGVPHYPPPPGGGSVDLKDPYVDKMKHQYHQYRLRRAKLPAMAYFCVDILEEKYGGLPAAAEACGVSKNLLVKIRSLSSSKGGKDARKAAGADKEFTKQEKLFLKEAVEEVIIRAAQVAADDSQRHPQITMVDLPSL